MAKIVVKHPYHVVKILNNEVEIEVGHVCFQSLRLICKNSGPPIVTILSPFNEENKKKGGHTFSVFQNAYSVSKLYYFLLLLLSDGVYINI